MKKLLFLSLFFIQVTSYSQDANQLLKRVVEKITSVKDYSVDASVKTDIPFIKILPVKAKIFFKLIRYKRYKNVYNIIEGELSPFILPKGPIITISEREHPFAEMGYLGSLSGTLYKSFH